MQKTLLLVHCFSVNLSNQQTVVQTSITDLTSSETVIYFFNCCREVCVESLYDKSDAKQIGGVNLTVEIDVAKYNRGKIVEGQCVLGGIFQETKQCFLVPVVDDTENSLIALIKRKSGGDSNELAGGFERRIVHEGSIVHTDCFPSYNGLESESYRHLKVNHSENFVDPLSGACTNLIESTWWAIR